MYCVEAEAGAVEGGRGTERESDTRRQADKPHVPRQPPQPRSSLLSNRDVLHFTRFTTFSQWLN